MQRATRIGDLSTGHDACQAMPLEPYDNPNVFINGLGAGRLYDKYETHGCPAHAPHQDFISQGSSTVFINGLPAGRVGDAVNIGGEVAEGSESVFIGGG